MAGSCVGNGHRANSQTVVDIYKRKGGKQTAGGQRLRLLDIVSKDLKKCQIDKDQREIAQNLSGWTAVVQKVVENSNMDARVEKPQKDKWKQKDKADASTC